MSESGTVIVVDDDQSLREALERLLRSVGYDVILFGSAAEFRAAPRPPSPCCLVLDVRMPGRSGLDLQQEMTQSGDAPPIIFISGHGDIPMTVKAMKAGAVEFLPKPFRDQELLDAVAQALVRDAARQAEEAQIETLRARLASLTARERQVMAEVVKGLLNKQVAAVLGVSEITVKVHRGQVMRKMGASSMADLVRMADRLDLANGQA
jgi:FixJ family two-component response regulator